MKKFIELLATYIGFKSISTDLSFKNEMNKTVHWLEKLFSDAEFEVSLLQGGSTNPVVLANYHQSDDMETVLVYGHYDVQPAEKEDGWETEPFVLSEKDGRLYGRGMVDNKGQNLIHIYSVIELIKSGQLGYNVKFMIEGNEETGNPDMSDLVKEHISKLEADIVIISDGEIVGDTPSIEASLKGGFNAKVTLTGPKNDLHSGLYGGAIPNPALEAARLAASLRSVDGTVNIPGFYDGVLEISDQEQENLLRMPDDSVICGMAGIPVQTRNDKSFYAQVGLDPTIEISGINSGYTGEGYKNIIPSNAEFRVNVRTTAEQDPKTIQKSLRNFIFNQHDNLFDFQISFTKPYNGVRLNVNTSTANRIKDLLKETYGITPVISYVGGGIPIVIDFKAGLDSEIMLVPLGNDDCNMHGVNENFRLDLIESGIAFSQRFFSKK